MKHGAKNHSNTRKILNSNNVHTHTHAAGPLLYHALLSVLQKCSQPVIGDEQKREKPLLLLLWSNCRVWLLFCPKFDWMTCLFPGEWTRNPCSEWSGLVHQPYDWMTSLFPGEWTRNPCSEWSGLVHQPHHTGCGRAQLWRGRGGSVLHERPAKIRLRVSVCFLTDRGGGLCIVIIRSLCM